MLIKCLTGAQIRRCASRTLPWTCSSIRPSGLPSRPPVQPTADQTAPIRWSTCGRLTKLHSQAKQSRTWCVAENLNRSYRCGNVMAPYIFLRELFLMWMSLWAAVNSNYHLRVDMVKRSILISPKLSCECHKIYYESEDIMSNKEFFSLRGESFKTCLW